MCMGNGQAQGEDMGQMGKRKMPTMMHLYHRGGRKEIQNPVVRNVGCYEK